MKIVNIDGENLHAYELLEEFQWHFQERCDQGFTFSIEDTFLEKPQGGGQIDSPILQPFKSQSWLKSG